MLDDKQNHLLQMGVLLSTATVVVNFFIVVAGILGMNIRFNLFNDVPPGNTRFLWTCGGGMFSCIVLYIFAIAGLGWCDCLVDLALPMSKHNPVLTMK